jgi:hypothetical protein
VSTEGTARRDSRIRLTAPAPRLATATLIVMLAVGFAVLMLAGRHLTFFYDEWNFILLRRGGSVASFLDPHNGHIVLFEVAIYKALLATVGLRHYWPYQAINALLHIVCVALIYVLARRRLGPWAALAPTALLLFMGSAGEDLLWPFQMGWFASVAGGLGALALLEAPGPGRDAGATGLLVLSLTGSAVGVAFLIASLALVLCDRDRWSRIWVIVVPAVLFIIWYLGWGTSQPITSDALLGAPQYVATAASGATAGLLGLNTGTWGPPVLVALIAALAVGFRARPGLPLPRLAICAAIGAVAFWGLVSISRADYGQPDSSRYLYVGAVFIILLAAEARLGLRLPGPAAAAVIVLVIGAVVANIGNLRSMERSYRSVDTGLRVSLSAVQVAAPLVNATYQPDPTGAPQIEAGPYLATERRIGSPAFTVSQLLRGPESEREQADSVLDQAEDLAAVPARLPTRSQRLSVDAVFGGRLAKASSGCRRFVPMTGATGSLDLTLRQVAATVTVRPSGASLLFYERRFAAGFSGNPIAQIGADDTERVAFQSDAAPLLLRHVQLVSTQPFAVCVGP